MLEQSLGRWAVVGLWCLIQSQVLEDLLDNMRILYRGDDANRSTALLAFLYVNGENALQALRPSAGGPVSSKPWASAVLLARPAVRARRICGAYCSKRTPHGIAWGWSGALALALPGVPWIPAGSIPHAWCQCDTKSLWEVVSVFWQETICATRWIQGHEWRAALTM